MDQYIDTQLSVMLQFIDSIADVAVFVPDERTIWRSKSFPGSAPAAKTGITSPLIAARTRQAACMSGTPPFSTVCAISLPWQPVAGLTKAAAVSV